MCVSNDFGVILDIQHFAEFYQWTAAEAPALHKQKLLIIPSESHEFAL